MNLIKSLFIFCAPLWLTFVCINAGLWWMRGHDQMMIAGVWLSALPLVLFLGYLLLLKRVARTTRYLPSVLLPSMVGYCWVLLLFFNSEQHFIELTALIYALSAFFATFLYVFWYSNNGRQTLESLTNGQPLPEFEVFDLQGRSVSSDQFVKKQSLLFFYRGNWCPLCMAQIDEVVKHYRAFETLGVQLIFIAPQPAEHTQKLADKFALPFKFYVDRDNRAARSLGLLHANGLPMGFQALGYDSDSVYPTVLATNEQGVIIYNDQTANYRLRPEPEELISVFSV